MTTSRDPVQIMHDSEACPACGQTEAEAPHCTIRMTLAQRRLLVSVR